MAEQASDKQFNQKEDDPYLYRHRYVDLGQHVSKACQHHHQQTCDETLWQNPWKLEGKNQREEINSKRQNPEQGNGRYIRRQMTCDGAQLHGCAHRQQHPQKFALERRG